METPAISPSPETQDKLYYTTGEVAAMFGENASLIRYWDKEFGLSPQKNRKGNRLFTKDDIETVALIHHYVKERGMTLKGAQQKLKVNRHDAEHNYRIVQSLQKIRATLLDLKKALDEV